MQDDHRDADHTDTGAGAGAARWQQHVRDTIDPEFLALLTASPPADKGADDGSIRSARARFAAGAPRSSERGLSVVSGHVIEDRFGVRRYQPNPGPTELAVVYAHGGGWCLGSVDTHDLQARIIASTCRLDVVSVDYRLAPEHRFPAALDDVRATIDTLLDRGVGNSGRYASVALAGDSAGANLVAAAALRGAGDSRVRAQLLNYGVFDLTRSYAAGEKPLPGPALDGPTMRWFVDQYLAVPAEADQPDASPLRASSFAGVCATVIASAGLDILAGESAELARRMAADGVDVAHLDAPSLGHGYLLYVDRVGAARAAFERSLHELLARLAS